MDKKNEHENCKACRMIKGIDARPGGLITLSGGWVLNHYGGSEGFLGWLALSPQFHRMELTELEPGEASALGSNTQNIDMALRNYWAIKFPEDPIIKVYVNYFFESPGFHLHFHLIPRTKSFAAFHPGKPSWDAWDTPKLTISWDEFPENYRIRSQWAAKREYSTITKPEAVENLMTFIRSFLWKK